ncbi:MAG: hypothetical protein KA346_08510 [Neisseriaceae bacterium]|nr:hypothetical protein [Neisseriaceae bacterium]
MTLIGFELAYERAEEGFVYLNLNGAQIMLEQEQPQQWIPTPLQRPLGNGLNLQLRWRQWRRSWRA